MRELQRILSPDGVAVLTVPQADHLTEKVGSFRQTPPAADRLRLAGQEDHQRIYGEDFAGLLRQTGFHVKPVDEFSFPASFVKRHCLRPPVLSTHPLATNRRKVFFARKIETVKVGLKFKPVTDPLRPDLSNGFRSSTNGTSVYVSRVLRGREYSVVHLMWDISESGAKSVEQVVVADDAMAMLWWPFLLFYRGLGVYMRWRSRLGLDWWSRDQLNLAKLNRKLRIFRSRPRRAWVICMHEWDASRACALWEGSGKPPFVLHVMDIFHDRLSEEETPNFRRLIREATRVLCISANIAAEMRNNGAKSVSLLPLCSGFSVDGRQPFGSLLRIVVSGTHLAR